MGGGRTLAGRLEANRREPADARRRREPDERKTDGREPDEPKTDRREPDERTLDRREPDERKPDSGSPRCRAGRDRPGWARMRGR
jgi:hypothetical protein